MQRDRAWMCVTLCCTLLAGVAGCRRKMLAPSPTFARRPVRAIPSPDAPLIPPPGTPPGPLATLPGNPPPSLVIPPPRTVRHATPGTNEPGETEPETQPTKPTAPQLSPQLSPSDQSEYERKTNDDLAAAERNLTRANGRQLNSDQRDMVEKIRSFIGQARDAGRASDWPRARNLAQKAYLLSRDLVNSL